MSVLERPRSVRPNWLDKLHQADAAWFARATQHPAARTDAVLYPLTRAADHSKLWLASALALAARGGRSDRRAALRGLMSVGATSLITNAVIKPLVARPRPSSVPATWRTRMSRVPLSTSFPSGHAASAAAFAVGAAIEAPALAAPLGMAAAAVGWSRIRTRVHYPMDVVAGFVIGAAIAWSTRRLWPTLPGEPAITRAARPRSPRADTDGAGLGVVVNPSAGSAARQDLTDTLQQQLPRATFTRLADGDDLDHALEDVAAHNDTIGIVGGDGSVNAAAAIALRSGKSLAVFPGGTLNHFARDLGFESLDDTIEAIRSKSIGLVDVGLIADETFINTASFGSYASLVDLRERHEERLGKWLAMAVALVVVLQRAEPLELTINGTRRAIWLIFIGNGEYGPPGLAPSWRTRLDDGVFDVRFVEDTGPYSRLRFIASVLTGRTAHSETFTRELLQELTIESHGGPLRLARDGETFDGPANFTIRKNEGPLEVYRAGPPR